MTTALKIIMLISGIFACVLILMQGGQTTGLINAVSSKADLSLFSASKSRGSDLLLERLTAAAVIVFLAAFTVYRYL